MGTNADAQRQRTVPRWKLMQDHGAKTEMLMVGGELAGACRSLQENDESILSISISCSLPLLLLSPFTQSHFQSSISIPDIEPIITLYFVSS
jgi:hypothetical protein